MRTPFVAKTALFFLSALGTLAAGAIDPGFPPLNTGFGIVKLGLQSGSRILAAGTMKFDGSQSPTNLMRIDASGQADPAFSVVQLQGSILSFGELRLTNPPTITAFAVQSDDKILMGGAFDGINGSSKSNLVRLHADGTVDPAFHAVISAVNGPVSAIVPLAGGKLLISGGFDTVGGAARKSIAKLNPDGTPDPSFIPVWSSTILGGGIQALAVQSDGRIVAAGAIGTFANFRVGAVAALRFNADGTLDNSFTPPALPALTQSASSVALQADGSIIIAGSFASLNGVARSKIARLSSNGTVDPSWGGAGVEGNAPVSTMTAQPDGKVIVAGNFTRFSGENRKGFVRLNPDGTIDPAFQYTDGSTTAPGPVILQEDGKIVAAGSFTLGTQSYNLLRLLGSEPASSAPVITTQPAGQTVNAGATVTLTVVATGGASLTYQWFRDGAALNGETHSTLTLFTIQPGQAGSYHVVVSNGAQSTPSAQAVVVVNTPPVITAGPQAQQVTIGGSATFSVTATGTAPLSYEWRFNGTAIPNQTGSTLSLQNVRPDQAGKYRVAVRNSAGEAISAEVDLAVTIPPPVITQQPASQTAAAFESFSLPSCTNLNGSNLRGAVLRMNVLDAAAPFANSGTYTISLESTGNTYHLSANGINPARDGTWSFGPDLGIATVLTVSNYFGDSRITHWALLANCEYELYADNMVSSQHGAYSVTGGSASTPENVTFAVEASGAGPMTFQWFRNGSPLPGATSNTLTVPAITANAGSYTVVVTNGGGSIVSRPALLTLEEPNAGVSLQFAAGSGTINLSWPPGYALQSTASLSAPGWGIVTAQSPQNIPTQGRQQFFRLIKSP